VLGSIFKLQVVSLSDYLEDHRTPVANGRSLATITELHLDRYGLAGDEWLRLNMNRNPGSLIVPCLSLNRTDAILRRLRLFFGDSKLFPCIHFVHQTASGGGLSLTGENLSLSRHLVELNVKEGSRDGGKSYTDNGDPSFKGAHGFFTWPPNDDGRKGRFMGLQQLLPARF
jgi:hypothetical protein